MLTVGEPSEANEGCRFENLIEDLCIRGGVDQVTGYLQFISNDPEVQGGNIYLLTTSKGHQRRGQQSSHIGASSSFWCGGFNAVLASLQQPPLCEQSPNSDRPGDRKVSQ